MLVLEERSHVLLVLPFHRVLLAQVVFVLPLAVVSLLRLVVQCALCVLSPLMCHYSCHHLIAALGFICKSFYFSQLFCWISENAVWLCAYSLLVDL